MPRYTTEVTSGAQFSRSMDDGVVADSLTRSFKVLLEYPGEAIDIQSACGVYIGFAHPYNANVFCSSFDARYDGESRSVLLCTFQYKSRAAASQQDPQKTEPIVRPANWSTAVATYESPVRYWRKVTNGIGGTKVTAANALGDMYDGISRLEPIITISVEQFEQLDPLRNNDAVGCINDRALRISNSLNCPRATVMLRSIQSDPAVESWGNLIYRGWKAKYEFLFKRNPALVYVADEGEKELDIGWDIAVPQTGFSVKSFLPNAGTADQDITAQPLRHSGGKIIGPPYLLPENINANEKVRAMVKVFEYENGGSSQTPSAQPIPLNDDGTPRVYTASPKVLVYRYRIYEDMDFSTLNLRLT